MRSSESFAALLAEQMRAVGLALYREAALAAAALTLICVSSLVVALKDHDRLLVAPELLQPSLLVAMLLPYAVWKGDPVFGRAFLWTLPVRRQHAAVAKVIAGAVWMLLAMLVTLAALTLVSLISGGTIGFADMRYVDGGTGTIAGAARVAWVTPAWMWLMPFAGALLFYLLSSAALLGLRHPVRWAAGILVALTMLIFMIATLAPDGIVKQLIERVGLVIWGGSAGLDFALTGGSGTLTHRIDRPGPGADTLWSALPSFGRWVWATCVWLAVSLLALALAIRRHWER